MISLAYRKTFTRTNIRSSFRRSGIWPLDASQLLSIRRPRNSEICTEALSVF